MAMLKAELDSWDTRFIIACVRINISKLEAITTAYANPSAKHSHNKIDNSKWLP